MINYHAFVADSLHFQTYNWFPYLQINYKLSPFCYWILTRSMFSLTSRSSNKLKICCFCTGSLHFQYCLIICMTYHDPHLLLDLYTCIMILSSAWLSIIIICYLILTLSMSSLLMPNTINSRPSRLPSQTTTFTTIKKERFGMLIYQRNFLFLLMRNHPMLEPKKPLQSQ